MNAIPRILVVNPNTSSDVTDAFVAACRQAAGERAAFTAVTGRFGARIVSTEAENVIAGHSALELLALHARDCDAVILAISFDTALDAARELLAVPVVGITEALLATARVHGPVGLIIFGSVSLPLYERLLHRYGARDVLAGIEVVETATRDDYLSSNSRDDRTQAAGQRLIERGARSIAVCGAAVVGIADRLAPSLSVPIFDFAACAVAQVRSRLQQPAPAHQPATPLSTTSGIAPELSRLILGQTFQPNRNS